MDAPHRAAAAQRAGAERFPEWLSWLLLVLSAIYCVYHFALSGMRPMLAAGIPDDATYYFKIAQNIAAGKGSTFDGIHATNGFHPLWQLALVPLYRLVHGPPEFLLRLAFMLQIACLTVSGWILFRLHRRLFPSRVALVSMVLFLFLLYFRALNGMESALLVLTLTVLFLYSWRSRVFVDGSPVAAVGLGLLLALVTLARLDMIFLPMLACLVLAAKAATARHDRRSAVWKLVMTAIGFSILVGPYLAYNQACFGGVMPISGALKTSFPHIQPLTTIAAHVRQFAVHALLAAISGAYLAWYFAGRGRKSENHGERAFYRGAMALMAAAVVAHFAYTMLFTKWALFGWYFIPYALLVPMLVSETVEKLLGRWSAAGAGQALYWIAIALLSVVGANRVYRTNFWPQDTSWHVVAYDAAQWARQHTPPGAVFAMADAGHLAYFSERSVINLDGIVNNREFQEVIRDQRLAEYLKRNRVGYFAHYHFRDSPAVGRGTYATASIQFPSHLHGGMSDPIVLRREDEAYRSPLYREQPGWSPTSLVIWRIEN